MFLIWGLLFPKQIKPSIYYRFLEFDKMDKICEFERLNLISPLTKESVTSSYKSLKFDVWKPIMEQNLEKVCMEKIVWGTNIKKVAGKEKL